MTVFIGGPAEELTSAAISHEDAAEGTSYALSPISLRFKDAAVERRFSTAHLVDALPILRVSLLAAAATYAAFGALDAYIIPEAQATAACIRYLAVCPLLLAIVLMSYSRIFPRVARAALAVAMLVGGLGVVVMIALAGDPGREVYYAGLILVTIIGSSLVPVGWIAVAVVSTLTFVAYQVSVTVLNPISTTMLVNNDFFLCAAVFAGIGASYLQELKIRRIFVRDEGLRLAKENAEELRARAEAASKAKSEFLAVVSHELRTPLNAILGFSEMMHMRVFGPIGSERYVGYVADIHHSAEHLLGMITDILDMSKADVGRLTLSETNVELGSVLDQCLRIARGRAMEQGLRLSIDPTNCDGLVTRVDERLLKQAFLNLLVNAVKFTPSGGTVSVTVDRDHQRGLRIRFSDTGIGIAPSDLARVLQPFVQVESAFARRHGGAGLGLPLAKKIVELHGGVLSLSSVLGAGTVVTVRLPPERVMSPVRPALVGAA